MERAKQERGDGTIKERSDGRWEYQYFIEGKRKSVYAKTEAEAKKKQRQVLNELEAGAYVDTNLTVGDWLHIWLNEYKKGHVKQKTYQCYESFVRIHLRPVFEKVKLKNLTIDNVQRLLNQMAKEGFSTSTIKHTKITLHNALRRAVKNGLLIRNVAEAVDVPKGTQKERRILTLEEQKALIRVLEKEEGGFLIFFTLFTGLRNGEVLGLRWSDINMEEMTFTVRQTVQRLYNENGKTELMFGTPKSETSKRTIPLLQEIIDRLHQHRIKQEQIRILVGERWEENDLVFCTERGTPMDPSNFWRFLGRVSKKAGIEPISVHDLRHAFASRALEQGMGMKVVSEVLGHSSMKVTADIYTHVSQEHKAKEMQKMNRLLKMGKKVPKLKVERKSV